MLGGGLEPPCLTAYAPQTYVSAISPPELFFGKVRGKYLAESLRAASILSMKMEKVGFGVWTGGRCGTFSFSSRCGAFNACRMKLRVLLMAALVFTIAGCDSLKHKDKEKDKMPARNDMPDQSGDMAFQAFMGRLNRAVSMHDLQTIASMMTTNFGYRLDPPGEGDGVFQYWDQNNIWPDLQNVLNQKFVPKNNFMVAPAQFASDSQYSGYRAGMFLMNGSWKFAYFVKD